MLDLRVFGLLLALFVGIASWFVTCAAWQFDEVAAGVMPLDPREFEGFTVVTAGTGGAYENHHRHGPATVVGLGSSVLLVDAGRGVAEALRQATIPVSQPDTVLLTHLLPENTLGLDDLLVMGWIDGRREPVTLLGPPGTVALARAVEASVHGGVEAWRNALATEGAPRFDAQEIADGWSAALGGVAVSAGALAGGPTPALAYRFEARGRVAVVSGTGWGADALTAFAKGANLLVHQAVMVPTPEEAEELGIDADPELLRREARLFTTFEQAGTIARRADADSLVLVRLRPPPVFDLQVTMLVDDHYDGSIHVADDGDEWVP
ncbi:MAG: MBL fold metallo-hydrolase [Myxococcota bacterium]